MGLRVRKSIRIAPGVRATVSKSGVSYSAGTKYGRMTKTARGEITGTAKIPGSGISYSTRLSGRAGPPALGTRHASGAQPTPAPAPPKRPGWSRPAWEKKLYDVLHGDRPMAELTEIGASDRRARRLCAALEGFYAATQLDFVRTLALLGSLANERYDPQSERFAAKYLVGSTVSILFSDLGATTRAIDGDAILMMTAELYKARGKPDLAAYLLKETSPGSGGTVRLAEVENDRGNYRLAEILTQNLSAHDDEDAFGVLMCACAQRHLGHPKDAVNSANTVVHSPHGIMKEIKMRAHVERAHGLIDLRCFPAAFQDYEYVSDKEPATPDLTGLGRRLSQR